MCVKVRACVHTHTQEQTGVAEVVGKSKEDLETPQVNPDPETQKNLAGSCCSILFSALGLSAGFVSKQTSSIWCQGSPC